MVMVLESSRTVPPLVISAYEIGVAIPSLACTSTIAAVVVTYVVHVTNRTDVHGVCLYELFFSHVAFLSFVFLVIIVQTGALDRVEPVTSSLPRTLYRLATRATQLKCLFPAEKTINPRATFPLFEQKWLRFCRVFGQKHL